MAKLEQVHVSRLLFYASCWEQNCTFGVWGNLLSWKKLGSFEGTGTDFVFSKRHKIKSCISDVGPSKEEKMDQSCLCLCFKAVGKKKNVLSWLQDG